MEPKTYTLNIDPFIDPLLVFSPVIAACLTAAFYSAKQLSHQAVDQQTDDQIQKGVLDHWALLCDAIRSGSLSLKLRPRSGQSVSE